METKGNRGYRVVDNIELIKGLLTFNGEVFYYLQVLSRKKDNPDLERSQVRYLSKCVMSEKSLDTTLKAAKVICNELGARVYISLIPRNIKKYGFECCKSCISDLSSGSMKGVMKTADKIAEQPEVIDKNLFGALWILDVDRPEDIEGVENWCKDEKIRIKAKIPTLGGLHILVSAFNLMKLENLGREKEEYVLDSGAKFALLPECNTIIYATKFL